MRRTRRKPRHHMIFCTLCGEPVALGVFRDNPDILTLGSVPDMIFDDCTTDLLVEDAQHERRVSRATLH